VRGKEDSKTGRERIENEKDKLEQRMGREIGDKRRMGEKGSDILPPRLNIFYHCFNLFALCCIVDINEFS